MKKQYRSSILLLITAIIWGVAFVAQDVGMDYWSPFAFNGIRSLIGAAVLLPFIFMRDKKRGENAQKWSNKTLLVGGVLCGIALCIATNFQQFGIAAGVDAGKAGFITAFYIVLVPIAGVLVKKKCSPVAIVAALIATVGLYILCIPAGVGFKVEWADLLVFICALMFTVQILLVDNYSPKVDGVKLACIEFATTGIISLLCGLVTPDGIICSLAFNAWIAILYAGVLSSGVAYTLQIVAQKDLNPTIASLIMSLEACVSVIAGWLILKQAMDTRQIAGCVIMFAAIILTQIPLGERKEKKQ